jgi:site-specific DNA recombinase
MKKAYGYCRISVDNSDGVSLENQRDRISAWAAASGHVLAGLFVEVRSGGRVDNRPELQKAISAACRDRGVLVVYSLSRFSRSVRDTLALQERLEKAGASLASLSESIDSSTPISKFIFQLISSLSELERNQIRQRTADALGFLRRGNVRISHRIPLGYDLGPDGKSLVPNLWEQDAIARILERRASGISLAGVARTMVEEGVPTKSGGKWRSSTVAAILARQQKLAA